MKLRVSHLTRYEYNQSVSFSPHQLFLRPREGPGLRLQRFSFNVSPHSKLTPVRDAYDNVAYCAHFWDQANALSIRSEFEVETLESNPFDFLLIDGAASYPFRYSAYDRYMLTPYLTSPDVQAQELLRRWVARVPLEFPGETLPLVSALNRHFASSLRYTPRTDGGIQDAVTTLETGQGTSRDLAAALIAVLRTLGFAARFVNGYLLDDASDQRRTPNAMHAWVEVYLPGAGWKGIDPSHGIFCADTYIPVAHAPQGECVSPIQGVYFSQTSVPSQLTTRVLVEAL